VFTRLLPLALATFAVGTDGVVIAGLLPSIADDLGVTTPVAGQLVTVFALTFAVAAPVLGAATSSMHRRSALLMALSIFVIGNGATALGTTYGVVMAARIVTAAGAGIITSSASSTAATIAPPERRGRALAFVMGGLTLALALGLPLGTLIGRSDWHLTLWAVAALGLAAAIGIAAQLPKIHLPTTTLRARLAPLKERKIRGILVVTMMALAGTYLLYTYIGSALQEVTSGSETTLTSILLAWGTGTLTGNILAGRLTDRYPAERILLGTLVVSTLMLAISPLAVVNLASTIVWAATWGICVGLFVVPQQHRLVAHAPTATPILLGLNSSMIYTGIALGGAIGGLVQRWVAPERLGLPAACITALAVAVTWLTVRQSAKNTIPAVATT
jgi:DHA1 family inner membrane transport protein